MRLGNAMKYQCRVCKFVFDEEREGVKWYELHEEWHCPQCGARKCSCVPLRGSDVRKCSAVDFRKKEERFSGAGED